MNFFHKGEWLEWGSALGVLPGLAILVASTTLGMWWWRRRLSGLPPIRGGTLVALRCGTTALMVFLLLQPVLVRPVSLKSDQVVAVLYDNSRSMDVKDGAGQSRAERLNAALAQNAGEFDGALRERFHVLEYGFAERLRPIQNRDELKHEGRETQIAGALQQVTRDLRGADLTAVVVLSDGGQEGGVDDTQQSALKTAGVPVYTVGVGEGEWRDLALGEVAVSRAFFDDAPARITAQFTATGLSGATVITEVLQNDVVQASEERVIEGDEVEQQVQLNVVPRSREWLEFMVRVRVKDDLPGVGSREFVTDNNEARALLDHREKNYRILYFTGRPNWQYKFVRHALAADPELHLSSLIRVSGAEKTFVFQGRDSNLGNPLFEGFEEDDLPRYDEAVFLRMGLAEGELAEGYPVKPEELYPFQLIIWSDIEADFFAPAQLRLTRDAVAERGASFLMLGGPHTLGGGGYAGSLLESMLPARPGEVPGTSATVSTTPEGFLTGVWALRPDREADAASWAALPPIPGVDSLSSVRIGASVLATAQADANPEPFPFLIQQSYGLGKSAVLATGETWPWHLQTESDNQDHERLWRQLVRSLVSTVQEAVALVPGAAPIVEGAETTLRWTVKDELFKPVEGATLTARVTSASGDTSVPLAERLDAPGTYEGAFTPAAGGKYDVVLEGANSKGEAQASFASAVLVEPDTRETRNARFDPTLLQRISEVTGGRYFPLDTLNEVAPAIVAADREHASVERVPLWHHPIWYGLLAMLLCAEWTLRRRWGQA